MLISHYIRAKVESGALNYRGLVLSVLSIHLILAFYSKEKPSEVKGDKNRIFDAFTNHLFGPQHSIDSHQFSLVSTK